MKKLLLFGLILSILSIMTYFGYQSYQKIKAKNEFVEQIKRQPSPSTFQWIGEKPSINEFSTIVLFFHPECQHCQYEAKTITEKQKEFVGVNLWWISFADSSSIKTFGKKYALETHPHSYLAYLEAEKVTQVFGSISIPHIFIYDHEYTLQKEFKGETKVEALLKYVKTKQKR
ncbi:TlpA family protein disulfide reductase [Flectobacillus major]|uniref:TlpA family protein disulfide reductase n=1 Tax=Flectobacillus major TaxID=103 RepID=UPI00131EF92F|nr:redoxin domain-containing protein [Flectobacillus major]